MTNQEAEELVNLIRQDQEFDSAIQAKFLRSINMMKNVQPILDENIPVIEKIIKLDMLARQFEFPSMKDAHQFRMSILLR